MTEFTSDFWKWFIFIPVLLGFIGLFLLIMAMSKKSGVDAENPQSMGHSWDGLEELNNPLPGWWLWLFILTMIFGIVYLILYPGSGISKGVLGWTSTGQYEQEVKETESKLKAIYEKYAAEPVKQLAANKSAMKTAGRIFRNTCGACHGFDATGAVGFPNLRDNDWLYGGSPETIKQSITKGRVAAMPAWELPLKKEGVENVAEYILKISGNTHDAKKAEKGKVAYAMCLGCHGPTGKGNTAMGAPNLTDNVWLYGGTREAIIQSISKGRSGKMPAHEKILDKAKIHLLTAYVYSLSMKTDKSEVKASKKK